MLAARTDGRAAAAHASRRGSRPSVLPQESPVSCPSSDRTGRRSADSPYLNSQKKTDANAKKAARGLKFLLPPFHWQFASERQGRQKPAEMRKTFCSCASSSQSRRPARTRPAACPAEKRAAQDPACRRNRQRRLERGGPESAASCRSGPLTRILRTRGKRF